jgi:predicted DNA-binding protein
VAPAKFDSQLKLASYYPPELVARLKRLTDATRIPQAAYLRAALENLLKKDAPAVRKTKG